MPSGRRSRRQWAEAALVSAGVVLFAALIYAAGPAAILAQLRGLGWSSPLLVLPYLAVYLVDSIGWWWVLTRGLPPEGRARWRCPSLPRVFAIRAAGEAVNAITPTAYLGGEPLKAFLLRGHGVPLAPAMTSALVSKTALMLTQGIFVFLGLLIALHHWYPATPLVLAVLVGLSLVTLTWRLLIGVQRRSPFTLLLSLSRRWTGRRELLARWEVDAAALDLQL